MKNLLNELNERIAILKLLENGHNPMILCYPYEAEVNLTAGKNQMPVFYNQVSAYNKLGNKKTKKLK